MSGDDSPRSKVFREIMPLQMNDIIDELGERLKSDCEVSKTISRAHGLSRGLCPPGTWERALKAFNIPPIENYLYDTRICEMAYSGSDDDHPLHIAIPALVSLDPVAGQFLHDTGHLRFVNHATDYFPYNQTQDWKTVPQWDGNHLRVEGLMCTGVGLPGNRYHNCNWWDGQGDVEVVDIGREVLKPHDDWPDAVNSSGWDNRYGASGYDAHYQRTLEDGTHAFAYWSFADHIDDLRVSWFKWWARPWVFKPSVSRLVPDQTRQDLFINALATHDFDQRIVHVGQKWGVIPKKFATYDDYNGGWDGPYYDEEVEALDPIDRVEWDTHEWGKRIQAAYEAWRKESTGRIAAIEQRILDSTKQLRAELGAEYRRADNTAIAHANMHQSRVRGGRGYWHGGGRGGRGGSRRPNYEFMTTGRPNSQEWYW